MYTISEKILAKFNLPIVGGLNVQEFNPEGGYIVATLLKDKQQEKIKLNLPSDIFHYFRTDRAMKTNLLKQKFQKEYGLNTRITSDYMSLSVEWVLGLPRLKEVENAAWGGGDPEYFQAGFVSEQSPIDLNGLKVGCWRFTTAAQIVPQDLMNYLWDEAVKRIGGLEKIAQSRLCLSFGGGLNKKSCFYEFISEPYFLTQRAEDLVGVEDARYENGRVGLLIRYSNGATHWTDEAIDCLPSDPPKTAKSTTPAPALTPAPTENICPKTGQPIVWQGAGMYIAPYKYAQILLGNTFPNKGAIKEVGAKWNAALTDKDGNKFGAWVLTPQMAKSIMEKF